MSNYIFNDSFGGTESQLLSTVAPQKKKQLPAIIFVCTALIASSIIILASILAFNAISKLLDKNSAPRVTNNTSYVSAGDSTYQSESINSENPFGAMKSAVVTVTTKTGSSGSGVIAGEFSDSNNKHGYYIITCASIINNNRSGLPALISDVTLENGAQYEALLCGSDNEIGIAVFKIYEDASILAVAKWASKDASLPSGLIIFGGVGGGVFNLNGELVGISTDGEVEEINFISAPLAFEAYERLTANQYAKKIL